MSCICVGRVVVVFGIGMEDEECSTCWVCSALNTVYISAGRREEARASSGVVILLFRIEALVDRPFLFEACFHPSQNFSQTSPILRTLHNNFANSNGSISGQVRYQDRSVAGGLGG